MALPAGASYLVLFQGPDGSYPALEWEECRVTVHGWSGTTVSVHHECRRFVPQAASGCPRCQSAKSDSLLLVTPFSCRTMTGGQMARILKDIPEWL